MALEKRKADCMHNAIIKVHFSSQLFSPADRSAGAGGSHDSFTSVVWIILVFLR